MSCANCGGGECIPCKVRADMTRGRFWVWRGASLIDSMPDFASAIALALECGGTTIRDTKTIAGDPDDPETALVWEDRAFLLPA